MKLFGSQSQSTERTSYPEYDQRSVRAPFFGGVYMQRSNGANPSSLAIFRAPEKVIFTTLRFTSGIACEESVESKLGYDLSLGELTYLLA